jgi:hypothetical protein
MVEVQIITIEIATGREERRRSLDRTQITLFENRLYWEAFGW